MPDTPPTTDAPEAATTDDLQAQLRTLQAAKERLEKDLHKHRTRADDLQKAQEEAATKALAEKSLQEQLDALRKQLDEKDAAAIAAAERATLAERKAALAGKVVDADAAVKLLNPDKHLDKDGAVDVDAFLSDFSFMSPQRSVTPAPGGSGGAPRAPSPTAQIDALLKSGRHEDRGLAAQLMAEQMKGTH